MQERQVSVDGTTHVLEPPFLVLATQNPIEYEGTYPLPEAQLDRFVLRTGFGYPTADDEWEMLERRIDRASTRSSSDEVVDRLDAARDAARRSRTCTSTRASAATSSTSSRATRESASVVGRREPARHRLALLKLSRCRAALAGRDFVTPDDVKSVAVPALAHRLVLAPELWVQRRTGEDVVREVLDAVPTPPTDAPGAP